MRKLLLSILLIVGGCTANQLPEENIKTIDYDTSTPNEIFDFYKALDLSEVTADVMYSDGIKEYKISDPEKLNILISTLNEIDTGYLYKRPEEALYIIYQLKDKKGDTYILESYIGEDTAYYAVNEYNLAFKIENNQELFDFVQSNADEVIDTGYVLNGMEEWFGRDSLIDGLVEEGLVKYVRADQPLTGEELMRNEEFLSELVSEFSFYSTYAEMVETISMRLGYGLKFDLPYGPVRYKGTEYTYNPETKSYDSITTGGEYLDDHYFAIAEADGIVQCFRYKANSISNEQTLIQMYRKDNKHNVVRGLEHISLMLYHMDEVEIVELNKNDLTSKIVKEANSKYPKTSSITLEDFKVIEEYERRYLSLDAQHIAAKLFNEVMRYYYNLDTQSVNYTFNENQKLISLIFTYTNNTKQSFIFSKETGLLLSDNDLNEVIFEGDPNQYIEQYMAKKNMSVCSGIYEEMMDSECYEPMVWSIDSIIKPEYRVTTTRYQITKEGQLVLPIMLKKQGVFDSYEYIAIDY